METEQKTGEIFLEEYQFALKQLSVAAALLRIRQQALAASALNDDDAIFNQHISELLTTSIEALNCFCP